MKYLMKKFLKLIFQIILLSLLLPNISSAITLNLEYPEIAGLDLNIHQDLNQIIAWFYYFIISIAGIAALLC